MGEGVQIETWQDSIKGKRFSVRFKSENTY